MIKSKAPTDLLSLYFAPCSDEEHLTLPLHCKMVNVDNNEKEKAHFTAIPMLKL